MAQRMSGSDSDVGDDAPTSWSLVVAGLVFLLGLIAMSGPHP